MKRWRNSAFQQSGRIPHPLEVLFINGDLSATDDNLSVIVGKAKSGKGYLLSAIAATMVSGKETLRVRSGLKKGTILYFDTEQGHRHVLKVRNRIIELVSDNPEAIDLESGPIKLKIYALRQVDSIQEAAEIVKTVVEDTEDLRAVIIDGIADLTGDVNNPETSGNLTRLYMSLSSQKMCHVFFVIHANKTDDNIRGHLGSELQRKCENVIRVEASKEQKGLVIVSCEISRNRSFDTFAFRITDDGPILDAVPTAKRRTALQYSDLSKERWSSIVETFGKGLSTSDAISRIKEELGGGGRDSIKAVMDELEQMSIVRRIRENKNNKSIWKPYAKNKD